MRRLGIIAAFPGELRPLVQGWRPVAGHSRSSRQAAWRGAIGQTECVAVSAGMGPEAAARACGIAEELGELDGFVSFGWAGALSCGMHAGRAYAMGEVVDAATGQQFAAASPATSAAPLRLVTIDHVAQFEEKRTLGEQYHAVLVDMEAATVARVAQQKGVAFYCLKAVSDGATDRLPDFSQFTDALGALRMPALLAHLVFRPRYWRSIAGLSRNSKAGAEAAAQALRELVETHAHQVSH